MKTLMLNREFINWYALSRDTVYFLSEDTKYLHLAAWEGCNTTIIIGSSSCANTANAFRNLLRSELDKEQYLYIDTTWQSLGNALLIKSRRQKFIATVHTVRVWKYDTCVYDNDVCLASDNLDMSIGFVETLHKREQNKYENEQHILKLGR